MSARRPATWALPAAIARSSHRWPCHLAGFGRPNPSCAATAMSPEQRRLRAVPRTGGRRASLRPIEPGGGTALMMTLLSKTPADGLPPPGPTGTNRTDTADRRRGQCAAVPQPVPRVPFRVEVDCGLQPGLRQEPLRGSQRRPCHGCGRRLHFRWRCPVSPSKDKRQSQRLSGGRSVQLPCATSAAMPMLSPSVG